MGETIGRWRNSACYNEHTTRYSRLHECRLQAGELYLFIFAYSIFCVSLVGKVAMPYPLVINFVGEISRHVPKDSSFLTDKVSICVSLVGKVAMPYPSVINFVGEMSRHVPKDSSFLTDKVLFCSFGFCRILPMTRQPRQKE